MLGWCTTHWNDPNQQDFTASYPPQCGTTSSSLVENLTICSIEVDQGIYDTDLNYL